MPLFLALLTLALLPTLALAQAPAAGGPAGDPDPRVEGFAADLDALRRAEPVPGLAVAVIQDGRVVLERGYGWAYVDDEVPVTPDTPFWIASVTKTFVGLLFLQLEDEGELSLDEPINGVPEWDGFCGWLSHSPLPFGRDLRCDATITLRHVLHHTVQGEPGTRFSYNPLMYSRLSRYLEHHYGGSVRDVEGRQNRLAQLVESHILTPAGMTRTMASQWQREKADVFFDMAQGYGLEDDEWVLRPHPERHIAGGAGVVATVHDLARYDLALDAGRLASPAVMRQLFTPATAPDGTVLPYAYGWYVQPYRGERLVWHAGWDEEAGFSALYLKVPDRRLTLILLANGEGLHWENPLDAAQVEGSPYARAFLDRFVFGAE